MWMISWHLTWSLFIKVILYHLKQKLSIIKLLCKINNDCHVFLLIIKFISFLLYRTLSWLSSVLLYFSIHLLLLSFTTKKKINKQNKKYVTLNRVINYLWNRKIGWCKSLHMNKWESDKKGTTKTFTIELICEMKIKYFFCSL